MKDGLLTISIVVFSLLTGLGITAVIMYYVAIHNAMILGG